jgi:hypothetical protein
MRDAPGTAMQDFSIHYRFYVSFGFQTLYFYTLLTKISCRGAGSIGYDRGAPQVLFLPLVASFFFPLFFFSNLIPSRIWSLRPSSTRVSSGTVSSSLTTSFCLSLPAVPAPDEYDVKWQATQGVYLTLIWQSSSTVIFMI